MSNKDLAVKIIEFAGRAENIGSITNCMTRMRLTVKDSSKVQAGEIKGLDGVLGLVGEGNYFQIVLGPGKAKKVTDEAAEAFGLKRDAEVTEVTEDWRVNKEAVKSGQKQSSFKKAMNTIANIFIPLIPAIIAAGLFFGLGQLIGTLNTEKNQMWEGVRLFFTLISGSFLGYLVIYTGINAARQFGATEGLGGMIGAITIGANIPALSKMLGLFNEEVPLKSTLTTGKGGIIGVIIGVWILAKIEKWMRKRIPDVLDLILTPFLTLLVTGLLYVFVIMPAAGYFSDALVYVLSFIINSTNPVVSVISGYVLAALFLPMVLLGLHHGLIPIYAVQLDQLKGVSLFPVLAMAGAGQVGAALAIYLKARKVGNKRLQKVITGALPAGLLGVGEPLIYGVTLPMFKPFFTAGLGAGFGGAYVMLRGVMANAWGPSGLVATAIMKPECMMDYVWGLVISYIFGFIITYFVIKDKEVENV
ncbi:PTS glucose transporter subunit IIB [Clostridiales bacterium COT073_COT-073]|nr:PTS glucose transporter subunit IIB [Clostridiales bacterium COT073_COT-073]